MASYAREPRAYELMVILLPELADDDLTGAIDRVSGYITDVNGSIKEILTDSPWGRRRLAYTIRFNGQDYRDGIYVIWHFDLEPSQMGDIERELKLDVRVIRYLVVHDDPKWGSPNEGNQPPAGDAAEDASRGPRRPVAAATTDVPATPAAIIATEEAIVADVVAEVAVEEAVEAEVVAEVAVEEAVVAEIVAEVAVEEAVEAEIAAEEAVEAAEEALVAAEEAEIVAEAAVEIADEAEIVAEAAVEIADEVEVVAEAAVEVADEADAVAEELIADAAVDEKN